MEGKGIRQNTPVSSKIYCHITCANSRLKRYKGKNPSLFQRGSKKWVPKRGNVYLLSKCERRECLTGMKYGNKILRKYLPLCTCHFPISDYISLSHRVNCNKLKLCYDIEKSPGRDLLSIVNVDAAETMSAPYCQGNVAIFGRNAGQQCSAMSLCALIFSKVLRINSGNHLVQIMNVGNELYSSLSMRATQSLLMFTELPDIVTVFERTFQLEYIESYSGNVHL